MTESDLLKLIQLEATKNNSRLFRNNTGLGWVGDGPAVHVPNSRDIILKNARPLHAGLFKGSGDLIGWTPLLITLEMVGKKVAVFTNIEGKDPAGRGKVRPEQKIMHEQVIASMGISGIVRSVDDYLDSISNFKNGLGNERI